MPTAPCAVPPRLLAADRRPRGWDPAGVVRVDGTARGAVAQRHGHRGVRRAETGPCGPLVLTARCEDSELVLEVHGPAQTPADAAGKALDALASWVGTDDDPAEFDGHLAARPKLADVARRVGTVRLARLPTVGEAVGRAVLAQLVQAVEAHRSMTRVAALVGTPASSGLWCWPSPAQVGRTPAWVLRRCGVSLRGARALHAAALDDARLTAAAGTRRAELGTLDARLRALPGVGAWTTAKVRSALGDPDAVPVGDWNLPARVCTALTGEDRGRTGWADDDLLEILEPFAGQRGRVIRLVSLASARGLLPRHRRRAPRAALSAHRYW